MIAEFRTQAMRCGGCANNIRSVLSRQPGVKRAEADPATKRVTVEFDEKLSTPAALAGVLADAGYPVDRDPK